MLTKEDLQAIADLMEIKLQPIEKRLDAMQEEIEEIKENTEITRGATNLLLEWAEDPQQHAYPLFKKAK